MTRTVDFYDFEEARITSGLFFSRLLNELDITERTYYRWKKSGQVPYWAMRIVELLSGDLDRHGWQHWHIDRGILMTRQLDSRYHYWTPGELLAQRLMGVNPSRPIPVASPLRTLPVGQSEKRVDSVTVGDQVNAPRSGENRKRALDPDQQKEYNNVIKM